jgi:Flp pilus assembly protein TadD
MRTLAVWATVGILVSMYFGATTSVEAQAATTPVTRSCSVRSAGMSPAEIADEKGDNAKAIELYTAESAVAGPDQDRAHDGLIRALIKADKVSEAEAVAKAWAAAAPKNTWMMLASEQVEYRKGDTSSAADAIVTALKADPCNAQSRVEFARFLALNGNFASAKKNLDTAHTLEPNNQEITDRWLRYQPRSTRLEAVSALLSSPADLSEEARKSLERLRTSLSSTPDTPCRLVTPLASTAIPYRALQDGPHAPISWGLDVAFNGIQRRMEIDTGASGLLLTKSAAAALKLEPEEHFKQGGIGDQGAVPTFSAKVKSIRIGGLEFQDCQVEVLTTNPNFHGDGLIGGDVFASFLLTLDFPGHQLKLDPLPRRPQEALSPVGTTLDTSSDDFDDAPQDRYVDPSMAKWSRIYRSHHDLIMPVRLNQGPLRLFILDTGSDLDLISPDAFRQFGHVSRDENMELSGVSGKVNKVFSTGPLTLEFAGLRKPSLGMTSIDTSRIARETGVEISGFLGEETLQQLTVQIDYRDNLVHLNYDPSRLVRCTESMVIPGCI